MILTVTIQMPCEAENPNVPVVLGLAYDPDLHSCDWPDLLTHRGCDPAERLGDFQCPSLTGQHMLRNDIRCSSKGKSESTSRYELE